MRKSLVLATVLLVLGVAPAWAHVSVSPDEAARGATATFTFTVPNEEAPATTTAVEIVWPDRVTFDRVTPVDKAGWTATTTEHSVKWSGGTISGTAKESFSLTVGPMPNDDSIPFKAVQTYNDGQVVRWIDVPTGAEEPDHPAPVVSLTGAPATTVVATTTSAASSTSDGSDDNQDSDSGGGVGVTALIVGAFVLAGIGGGIALSARRRAAQP